MNTIMNLGIVGAGVMGRGIARLSVTHGIDTIVVDSDEKQLARTRAAIKASFESQVERGKMPRNIADAALGRLHTSQHLEDLSTCELVIEAISEDLLAKRTLLATLDACCGASTILASNTSSLSISELSKATGRPDRFVGLHFFNPPTALPLLELVTCPGTSPVTIDAVSRFCTQLERVVVRVGDQPGFIVNRLLVPFLFDAIRLVEAGTATPEDIDTACRSGLGHAMGPLATADLGGLDTLLNIGNSLHEVLRDERYRPPALLRAMVAGQKLGRKTGEGFFSY
jgi:3-hydroxybutyryl-CoA dehydrogenase